MAVRHDYAPNFEEHHLETKYVDLVLMGWGEWTASERGPARPQAAGIVLHIATVREARYRLRLTDEQFVIVDARVAILATRLREIVDLEYRNIWRNHTIDCTQEEKWRRLGAKRHAYNDRLRGAQWTLYQLLLPHVENWRRSDI